MDIAWVQRSVLAIFGVGNVWHYLAFLNHLEVARHSNPTCAGRIQLNYLQEMNPTCNSISAILIPSKIIKN